MAETSCRRLVQVHARDHQAIGDRHCLRVDIGAADHSDFGCSAPQRVAACRPQRSMSVGATRPGAAKFGSRLATMLVRPTSGLASERQVCAHHHRLAHCDRAEVLHVRFEPPRQPTALPDHPVVGDGSDQDGAIERSARLTRSAPLFSLTPPPAL
jgi:hypothetical protein